MQNAKKLLSSKELQDAIVPVFMNYSKSHHGDIYCGDNSRAARFRGQHLYHRPDQRTEHYREVQTYSHM